LDRRDDDVMLFWFVVEDEVLVDDRPVADVRLLLRADDILGSLLMER
jgi:hypothetical protein